MQRVKVNDTGYCTQVVCTGRLGESRGQASMNRDFLRSPNEDMTASKRGRDKANHAQQGGPFSGILRRGLVGTS